MSRKIALLIGVSHYGAGLDPLRCPANGVEAMRVVLSNPEIGGFDEVIPLVDPDVGEMRSRISTTFAQRKKDDLVLLYFTGHGIKAMSGVFYLTTVQSALFENNDLNTGTAVEAEFIRREIGNCYAERKVVILDCCFAAAFVDGFMGMDDGSIDVGVQLGAQAPNDKALGDKALGDKGCCVLTAATSMQYALEPKATEESLSVYTRYLVEGLTTGGAAPDGEAHISLRHWHEYVKTQVKVAAPAMEPTLFNARQGDDIIIAKAHVDNEQRYRKQVQKKVQAGKGRLRPSAKANLILWQRKFEISAEQAAAIQAQVLKPYEEKEKHVKAYAKTLTEEKEYAYPLDAEAIEELQEQKRLLNLRDEDVCEVEEQILGSPLLSQVAKLERKKTVPKMVELRQVASEQNGTESGKADCFSEDLGNGIKLEMVRIPGGKFLMGAAEGEEGAREYEYPQHEVMVPEFWMGKFAVTQAQWQAVAGWDQVERGLEADPANFKGAQRPVERVSWNEAVEFCQRLSQKSKKDYRLPSEAQWEYACRAGTTTPFHFGPTLTTELANYGGNRKGTTDVGSFKPNTFGLYDMHGNVWEWCLDDWHDSYKDAPTDGEIWKISGNNNNNKIFRGGSWVNIPRNCRSATRINIAPVNRNDRIGFRVSCLAPRT